MNGMGPHTRKHTQAMYGGMAKEHEPAAANATRKGGPRKDNESEVHNVTLLPLSIDHQRGSRRGNTTNRSAPASATQPPPTPTSTPWYGTKGEESAHTCRHKCEDRYVIHRATENAAATNMVPVTVCYKMIAPSRRRPTYPNHSFVSQGPTRENDEPARKKTKTRSRAEAGKKCMPGRRVEERVKSNEATKETGGSQQPSKGRAQGQGHGRHAASTTPHRGAGGGSTRGTGEKRHRAPRHTPHRHHTHPRPQHVASEPRQPAQRAGSQRRGSV